MTETIKGLDELGRKLKKLEQFQKHMHDPMEESLALLQDDIATAPRKARGAFARLATPAQKRAYWARVGAGVIDHLPNSGYKRTSTMTKGWTYEITRTGSGLRGTLGNKKASGYGIYVQGSQQQPFHRESGWRTTDEAVDRNKSKIQRKFDRKVKQILNK